MLPTKNITVTNCVLSTCCNGFKIGTATHGVVENIVFSNSVIYNDNATPLNERATSGIALEMVDGGMLDGVTISNIRMQNARTPIFIRLGKRTPGAASYLRNVMISGVNATGAIVTSSITGVPGMPVEDITLADFSIETSEHGRSEWTQHLVPEQAANYPEARMFERLPASGLYVRHVNRLRLCNLRLQAEMPDARPAVVCDNAHDLDISGLRASASAEGQPIIALHESSDIFVHGSKAPKDSRAFVQVSGASSTGIVLLGNDLSHAAQPVVFKDGAVAASVSSQS